MKTGVIGEICKDFLQFSTEKTISYIEDFLSLFIQKARLYRYITKARTNLGLSLVVINPCTKGLKPGTYWDL